MFEDYIQPLVDFARAHEAWAAPIVFALAFMESLAFISLLVPAWGALGIFIGRFFGPLRAAVPLVAGIFEMPFWTFQIANFTSAFVWAGVLLTIGDVVSKGLRLIWG